MKRINLRNVIRRHVKRQVWLERRSSSRLRRQLENFVQGEHTVALVSLGLSFCIFHFFNLPDIVSCISCRNCYNLFSFYNCLLFLQSRHFCNDFALTSFAFLSLDHFKRNCGHRVTIQPEVNRMTCLTKRQQSIRR